MSKTTLQEPSTCFFQMATPLFSSVTDLPSGVFKDIRSVPVEYAKSPDWETSTFSVFQVIENPGVANAPETYSRIASLPTTGGMPGVTMVASSAQNGSTRFRSRAEAAASQSASVRRMAASSAERSTLRCSPHPAVISARTMVEPVSINTGIIRLRFIACLLGEYIMPCDRAVKVFRDAAPIDLPAVLLDIVTDGR